ncbi:trichoplein keratin filament-binding protein [Folsomia candida]|uniref:Cilia- and flagella-associated protein 53 n=1 Tax=Folsomia candida TaxID=158441 RepID=A0A226EZP7_FOLCA|nr:trichoplein keratin filament-binding protein [Folsomia candida]OXA63043.1 Cilia- and flagella-associated protein 53 [Folsomia candida]
MLETDRKMAFRQKMENGGEIRKIDALTKFKTETEMEERRMDLETRSDRLKRMMENEMFSHTQQMQTDFERQQESKIDGMRQRVKALKEKRLEEERQFVEKKLDLAFQNQCEQMRTLLSKRITKEIVQDWGEQVKMKKRLECEEEENDRMYAHLVSLDVENKWKREIAYDCMRADALKQGLAELDRQIQYKKAKAADQAKIQERELAINAQIQKELEVERRKREEEKNARFIKSKEHVKEMMATRDYYRDRRIKREEIVAQEFLRKAIRELYIEEADRNKAKRELMRSINIYLDYLKKRDCYGNSREAELQKVIDAVIEEQYLKVNEARRKEQAQRKQLFCNVLAGRAQQIDDLKALRDKEEMERQKELRYLKEDWKQYLREVEYEKEVQLKKRQQYRNDLDCQLQYQATVKGRDSNETKREGDLGELEEGFFLNRLNTTVKQAKLERSNPYREMLSGKKVQQCLRPIGESWST